MQNVDKTHFRTQKEANEAAQRYTSSCQATMKSTLLAQAQSTNKKLQDQINSRSKEFDSQLIDVPSLKPSWDFLNAECRGIQVATEFKGNTPERMTFSVQDSEQVSETYQEKVPRTIYFTESVPYQQKYTENVPYVEQYVVQVPIQVAYTIQVEFKKRINPWKRVTRYRPETRYRTEFRNETRTRMKERTDTKYRTAYNTVNRSKIEYYTENKVRTVSKNVTVFVFDHASVLKPYAQMFQFLSKESIHF
eukprot:TRINITY_DN1032_c0_g1_i2.p1 TRINITY_DN1032_c0_g1~~TRINITY_DN1032_c0_g1_i2.p1  ORF type:complete len:249 (-),score=36.22 TRINITY_DN1032_c0_g1_i2:284-1030(-)